MGDQGEAADPSGGDRFAYAPETRANAIPFQAMCEEVFEKMRFESSVNGKLKLLEPFLARVGRESAFPFMRLILPELDNLRDKYGVKTMKLAKLVGQMYFPDKASKQYQQLVLHTDPVKNPSPTKDWQITGDFPLTLQYILDHSPGHHVVEQTTWTLEQVNKTLDDLARAGSDAARAEVLRRIRVDCSSINQKWIMRIILKNLKIKLKKDSVLKKIHPDALDEYNRTTRHVYLGDVIGHTFPSQHTCRSVEKMANLPCIYIDITTLIDGGALWRVALTLAPIGLSSIVHTKVSRLPKSRIDPFS